MFGLHKSEWNINSSKVNINTSKVSILLALPP